jgi:exodeoxyribonuclease VII large subunit
MPDKDNIYSDLETSSAEIYSVSQLNSEVRDLIESNYPSIWVEGEISNLARPASGHIYFSLKDEAAQVRCAMFRMSNRLLKFKPENGMQILMRARVSLYEARGDFQLIADYMEESGDGLLRKKFEALKQKLFEEGLFDAEHKKDIPALPSQIGIITSPSGAAVRDIVSVLKRRFPTIPLLIYPIPVQGDDAPPDIVKMIAKANQRNECDVLILSRGGGSLEDLWAFNDEKVARAIYASKIPVVCGVGHEIDYTIADFVADVRAPTPSVAAELVSPDRDAWINTIVQTGNRLVKSMSQKLAQAEQRIEWLRKRIIHPQQRIERIAQRVDEMEQRLQHVFRIRRQNYLASFASLQTRLQQCNPAHRIEKLLIKQDALQARMNNAINRQLDQRRHRINNLSRALDAVSPLATLGRGYAIVKSSSGAVVKDSRQLKIGENITTQLKEGTIDSTVTGKN